VVAVVVACGVEGVAVVAGSVGADLVGVNTAAVNVNCEITVLAAEVRMAATSAVGSCSEVVGDPHAGTRIAISRILIISLNFMEPLDGLGYCST
jgi:hypothetical protein